MTKRSYKLNKCVFDFLFWEDPKKSLFFLIFFFFGQTYIWIVPNLPSPRFEAKLSNANSGKCLPLLLSSIHCLRHSLYHLHFFYHPISPLDPKFQPFQSTLHKVSIFYFLVSPLSLAWQLLDLKHAVSFVSVTSVSVGSCSKLLSAEKKKSAWSLLVRYFVPFFTFPFFLIKYC